MKLPGSPSRGRRSCASGGGPATLTSVSRQARSLYARPRGRACRTPCRGLRCSPSMRASKTSVPPVGSIDPSSKSGALDSAITSWPRRISRYSRSGGCRRALAAAPGRTTPAFVSRHSSLDGACPSARPGAEWACRRTASGTPPGGRRPFKPVRIAPSEPTGSIAARQSGTED